MIEGLKNSSEQPPGKWGKWNHKCTGIGESETWAHLGKAQGKWLDAAKICLQSNACGTLPESNSTKTPLAEKKIGGVFGTVYNDDDPKCYPKWLPWQKKKCAGIGQSTQSAKLKLPPGVKNTDENGEKAVLFCGVSGSTKCNNGNAVLNTPEYGDDDTFKYSEKGIKERWGTVTLNDDTYCYPTWQKWQPKQCVGYEKAKIAAKLSIDNRKDPKTNKNMSPKDIAEFCLKPENFNKCSGPSKFEPQYNPSLDVPSIASNKGSILIASTKGIGEAWGEIQFEDISLCRPKWQNNKPKSKLKYGIAQYRPQMQYKDGGKFKGTKETCNKLLQDLSYTSMDSFTWTPSGELCKDDTCYSTTLVKECTQSLGWIGGKFLRRDPSYATNMIGIWPWNWPQQISDAISYYSGKATDRIPP